MTAKEHLERRPLAEANMESWVNSILADGMRMAATGLRHWKHATPMGNHRSEIYACKEHNKFVNECAEEIECHADLITPPPPPTEAAGAWPRG